MSFATDGNPDAEELRKIALEQAAKYKRSTKMTPEQLAGALQRHKHGGPDALSQGYNAILGEKEYMLGGDAGGTYLGVNPEDIRGWFIGGDDNLQWQYDTEGNLINVAHKNTDQTDMALAVLIAAGLAGAAGTGLIGAGAGAGAAGVASPTSSAAMYDQLATLNALPSSTAAAAPSVRDVVDVLRIARNPVGAAVDAAAKNIPGSKDYIDLLNVVTGGNVLADVTRAANNATSGGANSKPPTTDKATDSKKEKGADAYGIPLGLLAMLGAQNQQQRPQIDPTYRPDSAALKFDPFR